MKIALREVASLVLYATKCATLQIKEKDCSDLIYRLCLTLKLGNFGQKQAVLSQCSLNVFLG
jgi:hypothetical protein